MNRNLTGQRMPRWEGSGGDLVFEFQRKVRKPQRRWSEDAEETREVFLYIFYNYRNIYQLNYEENSFFVELRNKYSRRWHQQISCVGGAHVSTMRKFLMDHPAGCHNLGEVLVPAYTLSGVAQDLINLVAPLLSTFLLYSTNNFLFYKVRLWQTSENSFYLLNKEGAIFYF